MAVVEDEQEKVKGGEGTEGRLVKEEVRGDTI